MSKKNGENLSRVFFLGNMKNSYQAEEKARNELKIL
jgi:hypothetical protein